MLRFVLLCLVGAASAQAQVITTIAGTDPPLIASGVPALSAAFVSAIGVTLDGSGNLYIADDKDNVVLRVSADGTLTVVAGNGHAGFSGDGGPATTASLNAPQSLAVDSSGNLYIADGGNNRIRKVSGGTISTVAGNGSFGFAGDSGPATGASFAFPTGLALDAAGNLYIADFGNNRIRMLSAGTVSTVAGNGKPGFSGDNGPANLAMLNSPEAVAVDSAGNLYIADTYNYRVRKLSGGTIASVAGNGVAQSSGDGGPATTASLDLPRTLTVDSHGNIYIGETAAVREVSSGTITTVAGNGSNGALGDNGPATRATLNYPAGVAVDSAGNLYIADYYRGRIRKVSAGNITTVAGNGQGGFGGDGGPATSALMNYPSRMALDSAGNLYIADTENNRIRKLAGGIMTTVAGNGTPGFSGDGGPATQASLNAPYGVAVDSAGNLFIADLFNNRIRKVANGVISTAAGNGTLGFSGEGAVANNVALGGPIGVAVDSAGNFYFADIDTNRIRKVSQGIITTVAGNGTPGFSGDGGSATSASLNSPFGVTVDSAGNLYITDQGNNRIRKVAGGIITTVAGDGQPAFGGDGGAATAASLGLPAGVAVDSAGNLYIADQANNRIRRVSSGIITTVAGTGSEIFSGDGGPAASASVFIPEGVLVDSTGALYISDSGNNRIRKVLSAAPSYQTALAKLTFSAAAGGSPPPAQVVALSSAVPGLPFSASASAVWLSVTPSTGTIPATLEISADPSTLAAGTYQGTVAVAAPYASPATSTITVTFTVQPAVPPTLDTDTQGISFTAFQGGGAVTQPLNVENTGGGPLAFSASAATSTGGSWLSISASSGTATPSSPASLTVSATPGSLAPGTFSGTVTISGAGKTIAIPVTLSVSAPSATIVLSQSSFSFSAVAQGGVPLPRSFGILNSGQGSLNWSASATTLTGGSWLAISPSSGTVQRPYLDVSLVNVTVDPSALAVGTYYGRIQVSATAVNTPQVITVILTVLPPGSTLPPQVFPAGLIFTGAAGVSPGSQDVLVGNPSGAATSFVSSVIGSGLDYLPRSASVQPNQPATLRVYPDFTNLGAGSTRQATITLQFSGTSSPQTISVLMAAAPAGTTSGGLAAHSSADQPRASGCPGQSLSIVFREPQPSQSTFSAVAGQATTIDVLVTDACGNLVGPGIQNASAQANFDNGDTAPLVHIGNGIWQGSWRPLTVATVQMQVFAFAPGPGTSLLSGKSAVLSAVVSATAERSSASTPTVTAQGVVHAASEVGGVPIAPGGLITIYGQNLADTDGQSSGLPLPQQLNGAQVLLGNQPLPILYTSPGQLNVQVPYGVPVNTQYQLTVQHGNTYSVPQQLVVAQAEPGIFTVNQQGSGQGSIVKSDGVTLAQPGTPAGIGETVVIYCTGLGSVTPKVAEGAPPPSVPPLATTDNPVTVTIGGQPATVVFSGLTPGDPGLYQINAVVPSGIATGDAVPVVISVAGQSSPAVTMAVK